MKIAALINVYNEEKTIASVIENIQDHVDSIVVCDGAYAQFPTQSPQSTDKTVDIAKSYQSVKVIETERFWPNQCEKRTAMFKAAKAADYFFIIDADEWVANPEQIRNQILPETMVGWVWQHSELYPRPYMIARILKNIPGLHHAGRHHWLFDENKNFVTSDQSFNPDFVHTNTSVRIFNQRHNRPAKRKELKNEFIMTRNIDEFQYKSELEVYGKGQAVRHEHSAGFPKKLFTILSENKEPVLHSMTLMVSRRWAISPYFRNLNKLIIPRNTELIVLIDAQDKRLFYETLYFLKRITNKFCRISYHFTGNKKLEEFSQVTARRKRIVDNWNLILPQVSGEYILGAEDDSLPEDAQTYSKMLDRVKSREFDFVQADIVSRWIPHIRPAWKVEQEKGEPVKVTVLTKGELEEIDACGWYCFATKTTTMRSVELIVDDYLPLGPDLRFGFELSKKEFRLGHDFTLPVVHLTESKKIRPSKVSPVQSWIKTIEGWEIK